MAYFFWFDLLCFDFRTANQLGFRKYAIWRKWDRLAGEAVLGFPGCDGQVDRLASWETLAPSRRKSLLAKHCRCPIWQASARVLRKACRSTSSKKDVLPAVTSAH